MPANADDLRERLWFGCRNTLLRVGQNYIDDARDVVPVRTGHLKDSIQDAVLIEEDETHFTVLLQATADYAEFVEFGTSPHVIHATNAPELVFFWEDGPRGPGIYHFRSVNHPGTLAQSFLAPTLDDFEEQLRIELNEEPFFHVTVI